MDVTKRHADVWPRETWTRMFIAAQFPRAQEEKQPKGPSVNGGIHKMWQSHPMGHRLAIERARLPNTCYPMDGP